MSAAFSNLKPPAGLLALSGMAYAGGKYTAEEWLAKTGFDPRDFRRWFYVSPVNQFCFMVSQALNELQSLCPKGGDIARQIASALSVIKSEMRERYEAQMAG